MLIRFDKESEYHFTTFSTYNDVHTLTLPTIPEMLTEHLEMLRRDKGVAIHGFVVMPNHMHIILRVPREEGISKAMKSFKGSTGRRIVGYLRTGIDPYKDRTSIDVRHPRIDVRHAEEVAPDSEASLSPPEIVNFDLASITRPDGRVALWQRRFYDFNLISEEKLLEKLDYIHNNPVKFGLVSNPDDWPYSSYRSWHDLENSLFEVDRF